jgi:hypothetical protein
LQIIEIGFTEWFYASHRMGLAQIPLKISARIAQRETYQMILLSTPPLFSLVNTFKRAFFKVKKFFGLPSSLNYKTKQFMYLFAGFPSNYSYQRDDSSSLSAWVFCPFCLGAPSQRGTRKPYYKQKRYSEFK